MAGLDEIKEIGRDVMPTIFSGGASFITWFIILILFIGGIGVATFFILRRFKFKYRIIIWERVGSTYEPTRKDRAMELRFGQGGDTVFYLLKHQKYLPNPSLQTGRNTFHFYVRSDGEWINFQHTDFDEKQQKMGAKFLAKEMRYARTQIQKGLLERYQKPG